MDGDTGLLFDLPGVARKKVSAAFEGGHITSDGGVALLALADRRIGIVDCEIQPKPAMYSDAKSAVVPS